MPARALPNLLLQAFFDLGEKGWNDEYDLNMLKLSILVQSGVSGKFAVEPGAPDDGDVILLDETHATHPNAIGVFDDGEWVYVVPNKGWLTYDQTEDLYLTFDGAVWGTFDPGVGILEAPEDGESYVRKDGDWVPLTAAEAPPVTVGFGFTTALEASEIVLLYTFAEAVTFPDDLAGAVGNVGTDPAATFDLDVQKNGASVGTISVSNVGAFTFSTSGGALSFAVGDLLSIIGPAVVGTAANLSATLIGERD